MTGNLESKVCVVVEVEKIEDVKLSIVMLTYCHEKYIRQSIDSVLMQKVDFKYELLIGDDHSTDDTVRIIKEYEEEHKDKIRPVLRSKNVGSKQNSIDMISRCKGDYIAFLEGDDYWTDCNKLQLQMDFLESNKDYSAVYHQCKAVDEAGGLIWEEYTPYYKAGHTYTREHMEEHHLPGQTGTAMMRNIFRINPEILNQLRNIKQTPLDRIVPIYLMKVGKIHFMQENMGAYRYVIVSGGNSFSSIYADKMKYGYDYFFAITMEQERIANSLGLEFDFFHIRMIWAKHAFYAFLKNGKFSCLIMCIKILIKMPKWKVIGSCFNKMRSKIT